MLFLLLTPWVNVLTSFLICRIAEKMYMGPVLVTSALHIVTDIDWFSSGGLDDFRSYDFLTSTLQGYRAEGPAPVKREKVNDGPAVPKLASADDVNRLLGVACKILFEAGRDYRWYRGATDSDDGVRGLPTLYEV